VHKVTLRITISELDAADLQSVTSTVTTTRTTTTFKLLDRDARGKKETGLTRGIMEQKQMFSEAYF
jgi:hypothetical protein